LQFGCYLEICCLLSAIWNNDRSAEATAGGSSAPRRPKPY